MFSKSMEGSAYRRTGFGKGLVFGEGSLVRGALQHPFGIIVLGSSMALTFAMAFLPSLERWSAWAPWVFSWGALCFIVSVFMVSRTRPTPKAQELRDLEAVRRMIAARIKDRKASEGWSRSAVTRSLEEVHEELEREIIPTMAELLDLQADLTAALREFESGNVRPDPEMMRRLKALYGRRKAIIEEAVQQAANAAATSIEVIQQHEQVAATEDAQSAAERLKDMFSALLGAMEPGFIGIQPEPVEPGPVNPAPTRLPSEAEIEAVNRALDAALKTLNQPPKLAMCELLDLIPCLIRQEWRRTDGHSELAPTQLELARSLREVIVRGIDQLKPVGMTVSRSARAMEHYVILHEQYVVGRPVRHVRVNMHIEERAYHYRRRDAVKALALHLAVLESQHTSEKAEEPVSQLAL